MAILDFFKKNADWSVLFVRLAVGLVFLMHGMGKLFNMGPFAAGISGVSGFLTSLGVPAAGFFAVVVALVEFLGGLAIILGIFVRYAAILLAIDMAFAIMLVHIPNGLYASQGELALVMFLIAISLAFSGAGKRWVLKK